MSRSEVSGDWQVSENVDGNSVVITPNAGADKDGAHFHFVVVCTLTKHALEDERARLISAAPDLLTTAKAFLRIADRDTDEANALRAAIAKAEDRP